MKKDNEKQKKSRSSSASSSGSSDSVSTSGESSSGTSSSSTSNASKEREQRKSAERDTKNSHRESRQERDKRDSRVKHEINRSSDRRVDNIKARPRSRSRSPRQSSVNSRVDRAGDRDRYRNHSSQTRRRPQDHDEVRRHDHRTSREVRVKVEPKSPAEADEDRVARRENERKREETRRKRDREEESFQWGMPEQNVKTEEKPIEKEKPSFEVSGNLAADTNTYNGVVVKYIEPAEARKPKIRWRLFPFKGEESLPVYFVHRQSAYLFGKDRRVADIGIDHPSCSKQHAVLQFRLVPFTKKDGGKGLRVRPYIIDLGSANGTFVNNKKIESQRYYELFEKDVIKFAYSSRDYVLMNETAEDSPVNSDDEGVEFDPSKVKKEPA